MSGKNKSRERMLIVTLVLVLAGSWVNQKVFLPLKKSVVELERLREVNQKKISDLQKSISLIEGEEKKNTVLEQSIEGFQTKINDFLRALPGLQGQDDFLYHLAYTQGKDSLIFENIKPIQSTSKQEVSLSVKGEEVITREYEIVLLGPYAQTVEYLEYLSHISKYGTIRKVDMHEGEDENHIRSKIKYAMVMNKSGISSMKGASIFNLNFKPKKRGGISPFYPKSKLKKGEEPLAAKEPKKELPQIKIKGILTSGDTYRVIIGQEIFSVGQVIEDYEIISIQKDHIKLKLEEEVFQVAFS